MAKCSTWQFHGRRSHYTAAQSMRCDGVNDPGPPQQSPVTGNTLDFSLRLSARGFLSQHKSLGRTNKDLAQDFCDRAINGEGTACKKIKHNLKGQRLHGFASPQLTFNSMIHNKEMKSRSKVTKRQKVLLTSEMAFLFSGEK